MTQAEVELIARAIRTRCLHSSWSDLVGFWQGVIGNLEGAYRVAVQSTAAYHHMSSGDSSDAQRIVRDKLAVALSQLAGERQVTRWYAEATGGTESPSASKDETLQPEGGQVD